MEKQRVFQAVVAHPLPRELQRICHELEKTGLFRVVYSTHDGLDCLREVISLRPDLLILHTVLEKLDGLEVLRRLQEFPLAEVKCLMVTDYGGYLADQALLAGASYCLLEPYSGEVLTARACELLVPPRSVYQSDDIDRATVRAMAEFEAPTHMKGYDYTLKCVRILVRDPGLIRRRRITEELYGAVGAADGADYRRVERALRSFTEHIMTRASLSALERSFRPSDLQRGHISNTVFLSRLAEEVSACLAQRPASA